MSWTYGDHSASASQVLGLHVWIIMSGLYTLSSIEMFNYGEGHILPSTDDLLITTESILVYKAALDLVINTAGCSSHCDSCPWDSSRLSRTTWYGQHLLHAYPILNEWKDNIYHMLTQHWMNERSLKFCFFIFPGWRTRKTEGRNQTQVLLIWSYNSMKESNGTFCLW